MWINLNKAKYTSHNQKRINILMQNKTRKTPFTHTYLNDDTTVKRNSIPSK